MGSANILIVTCWSDGRLPENSAGISEWFVEVSGVCGGEPMVAFLIRRGGFKDRIESPI